MFPAQAFGINPDEFSRCEERRQKSDHGKNLSPVQKKDADVKASITRAIWKDNILRALEYDEIDVHVKNGVVYLNGHIVSTASQSRIKNAIRAVPGILEIKNNLVLDDKLTLDVAASLGKLEHTYACKFFTGASHGVISLNGNVSDENVKLLAEKCAAGNPNVRGVINNVRVSGTELESQDQRFLQPAIGESIYFLDGVSAVVKQVIINPNNRRVMAMTLQGKFTDQRYPLNAMTDARASRPDQLIAVRMSVVRYLTRDSGFLNIQSSERNWFMDIDPTHLFIPKRDWQAPYPYCPEDVLFPVEQLDLENQVLLQVPQPEFTVVLEAKSLKEQLTANDSLGG